MRPERYPITRARMLLRLQLFFYCSNILPRKFSIRFVEVRVKIWKCSVQFFCNFRHVFNVIAISLIFHVYNTVFGKTKKRSNVIAYRRYCTDTIQHDNTHYYLIEMRFAWQPCYGVFFSRSREPQPNPTTYESERLAIEARGREQRTGPDRRRRPDTRTSNTATRACRPRLLTGKQVAFGRLGHGPMVDDEVSARESRDRHGWPPDARSVRRARVARSARSVRFARRPSDRWRLSVLARRSGSVGRSIKRTRKRTRRAAERLRRWRRRRRRNTHLLSFGRPGPVA